MMSFGNYNVRHSSLTSRESFSAYSKQQNSSMMMYRGSQFSDVSFEIGSVYSTVADADSRTGISGIRTASGKNFSPLVL